VLLKETKTGYPMFRWFVIGHLAEAEEETVRDHPDLANEIREYRTAWDGDESTIIPFEELLAKIEELMDVDDPDETRKIPRMDEFPIAEKGALGTEPSPVGEFGQTGPAGQLEGTGE
jgi:hypothetical protein